MRRAKKQEIVVPTSGGSLIGSRPEAAQMLDLLDTDLNHYYKHVQSTDGNLSLENEIKARELHQIQNINKEK